MTTTILILFIVFGWHDAEVRTQNKFKKLEEQLDRIENKLSRIEL